MHNSEPARHILKNVYHIIMWTILAPAPQKRFIRKNLEALFIILLKPSLNEQKEFDCLILFKNGVTYWIAPFINLMEHWKWINKFEKLLLNKNYICYLLINVLGDVFVFFMNFLKFFLSKRCSLKKSCSLMCKKRQFIISAESLKNTLEGVFFSKIAGLLAATWLNNKLLTGIFQLFCLVLGITCFWLMLLLLFYYCKVVFLWKL